MHKFLWIIFIFFVKWLYMFRTIISPSLGATFNTLYSATGTCRYVWLPELFLSHSRAPGSTALPLPSLDARTLNTTYSQLPTPSLNKPETNQFRRPTDRRRFSDNGRLFLKIYCKESTYSVGYCWITRRHLDWELGINGWFFYLTNIVW